MRALLLLAVFFFLLPTTIDAQSYKRKRSKDRRFKAGVVLGMNAAQIDGDDQVGYNHIGVSAGLRGIAVVSPGVELSFELLYSQKGSTPSDDGPRKNALTFDLNYAEVPILINILSKEGWDEYRHFHLQVGFSYARLLSSNVKESLNRPLRVQEVPYSTLEEEFNSNEINIIVGGAYYFNRHFGLALRHGVATSKIFNKNDYPHLTNKSLRSYYLNIQAIYIF